MIYSRRYYQDGMEDFSRFEDEGVAQTGASLASVELKEWQGTGPEFYKKFAGDPKLDGRLWIRETEELYNGTITALDDQGRKEAVLRYKNGKYQGTISKWDEDGNLGKKENLTAGFWSLLPSKKVNLLTPTRLLICPKIQRWPAPLRRVVLNLSLKCFGTPSAK